MKPVIKKQTHYTILLMRDDTPARNFRVRASLIKALSLFFLLLMVAGGLGIAGGIYFFEKNLILVALTENQEKELGETRVQLERLVNLESLITVSNNSVPLAKNEEVGASATTSKPGVENEAQERGADNIIQSAAHTALPEQAHLQEQTLTPEQAAASEQTALPEPPEMGTLTTLALNDTDSPLRINDFQARIVGKERLRVSYELSTAPSDEQRTVSGFVHYKATLADGSSVDLSAYDVEGTRFAIARMKPMQNSVRLPRGLLAENVNTVHVIVELADGKIYQNLFNITE